MEWLKHPCMPVILQILYSKYIMITCEGASKKKSTWMQTKSYHILSYIYIVMSLIFLSAKISMTTSSLTEILWKLWSFFFKLAPACSFFADLITFIYIPEFYHRYNNLTGIGNGSCARDNLYWNCTVSGKVLWSYPCYALPNFLYVVFCFVQAPVGAFVKTFITTV